MEELSREDDLPTTTVEGSGATTDPSGGGNGKPRPPRSAYDFFAASVRNVFAKRGGSASTDDDAGSNVIPPDLDRLLAQRWKTVEDRAREGYQKLATEDGARYVREMREWRAAAGASSAVRGHHASQPPPRLPTRLNLAVVHSDCPDLETEYIAVNDTFTLAEALRALQDAARSEWAAGWSSEDGGGNSEDDLELLGFVVGRRAPQSPAASSPSTPARRSAGSERRVNDARPAAASSLGRRSRSLLESASSPRDEEGGRAAASEEDIDAAGGERPEVATDGGGDDDDMDQDFPGHDDEDAGAQAHDLAVVTQKPASKARPRKNRATAAAKKVSANAGGGPPYKRPQGRTPVGKVWNEHNGVWEPNPAMPDGPPRKRRKVDRDKVEATFERRIKELAEFSAVHGHCDVSTKSGELGAWVKRVRMSYKHLKSGKPSDEAPAWARALTDFDQVGRLTDMGFRFVLRDQKERETFEQRLVHYIRMKEEVGGDDTKITDAKMKNWMSYARLQYKKLQEGKKSEMTEERIALLEQTGFVWNLQDVAFEVHLEELKAFKNTHGHLDIIGSMDKRLNVYAKGLRAHYYRLKEGKPSSYLTSERIDKLAAIGFYFDHSPADRLATVADAHHETIIAEFRKFREVHGHCNIAQTHPTLGQWVAKLRVKYKLLQQGKKTNLTSDHIAELEGLGFGLDGDEHLVFQYQQIFDEKIRQLLQFKQQTGDFEGHPVLSSWLGGMRNRYRSCQDGKHKLTPWSEEQFKRLEEIGVDLSARKYRTQDHRVQFEDRLESLRRFKEVHGNCDVKYDKNDSVLYKWVVRIRGKYARWREGETSSLTAGQVEQLFAVGFDFGTS